MDVEFNPKEFLATLTSRPGVYRMLGTEGQVLYVGKARNLKRRVASYFGSKAHHPKTQALMADTVRVEVTVTPTEQEALLLEYNLIKEHRPRYNVLLRDDKSYPYIYVSTHQEFPRFEFHRGSRKGPGRYFGPFPGAGSVRETLSHIQKLFRVRQCTDAFFSNRTRPCLQHQIGRCTAPCVGLVDAAEYRRDVEDAILFIQGRNDAVLASLVQRMEAAAAALEYERAARLRDQIAVVRKIQAGQAITARGAADVDALAVAEEGSVWCVALLMIRGGRVLGSRHFFPRVAPGTEAGEVVQAFLTQHYLSQPPPAEVLVPEAVPEADALEALLATRADHAVALRSQVRGTRRRWQELASTNAATALAQRLAAGAGRQAQGEALARALKLERPPQRIECFDISHTGGGETVAACVVFGPEGPAKADYRRFNITGVDPGDDYGAIAQAVERRYGRQSQEGAPLPDLVLVDGGKGQLARAREVLAGLGLERIPLAGVAKGPDRRPGEEQIFLPGRSTPVILGADSPALHLIQQVRDEAHRFAITGHRQRRQKARQASVLDGVAGLGPQRRRALLQAFGGLKGLRQAGVGDLEKVKGISRALAERIHAHLHGVDS